MGSNLQSDVGRLPQKPEAHQAFIATFIAFTVMTAGVTQIVTIFYLTTSATLDDLESQLGNANPITLSALSTGLIALAGLSVALSKDPGSRFLETESRVLQRLIYLLIAIPCVANVCWEYLAALTRTYMNEVRSTLARYPSGTQYESHKWDGTQFKILIHPPTGASRDQVILSSSDLWLTWTTPSVAIITLVSAATLSLMAALYFASRPQFLQLSGSILDLSNRVERREQATDFLESVSKTPDGKYDYAGMIRVSARRVIKLFVFLGSLYLVAQATAPFGFSTEREVDPSSPPGEILFTLLMMDYVLLGIALSGYKKRVRYFGLVPRDGAAGRLLAVAPFLTILLTAGFYYSLRFGAVQFAAGFVQYLIHLMAIQRIKRHQNAVILRADRPFVDEGK